MNHIGINLGSGQDWNRKGWLAIDKVNGNVLDANSILPIPDNSLEAVYSSHFFEHVDDATSRNLFAESYRVLKTDGIFRIVVPNFAIFIQKYKDYDQDWFRKVIKSTARPEWAKYGITDSLDNLLMHWVANYDYKGPKGFYRGPPLGVPDTAIRNRAITLTTQEFCEWAQGLIDRNDPKVTTQHINWWSFKKFTNFLVRAGFTSVYVSEYSKSKSQAMQGGMFDSWRPLRRSYSLYVETIK